MAKNEKNKAAVELGKLRAASMTKKERIALARSGGEVGGLARAESLSPKRRSAIARKAALARWGQ
jgi:hypothetical protein